eukprot:gb/GFBE01028196.1/.p1 GENE.gb/GFBE01028196.1/~~gb/GFBE01028196.1/.p1  ORF type:complete len:167 (+),score=42.73 gb/GFBE01028196.1/:1-501(+)
MSRNTCMAGNLIQYVGVFSSVLTFVLGIIHIYVKPPSFKLHFKSCGWADDDMTTWVDCNSEWQNNWGLTAVPGWCPLFVGAFGAMMLRPGIMQVCGFPRNFLQYGFWLIFQAFFSDFGYGGKIGVVTGWIAICTAIVSFVAAGLHIKSTRMLELEAEDNFIPKDED